MKLIMLLTCLSFLTFTHGNEVLFLSSKTNKQQQTKRESMKSLELVGMGYIELLNQIGAAQNLSHAKNVSLLIAPSCKKIVNGALWFEGVEHFLPQLLSTGEKVGFWSIEPLDIIPGKDERTVVVRFLVHTEKAGIWCTFVSLRCNDQLLITEINEVFNSFEGTLLK